MVIIITAARGDVMETEKKCSKCKRFKEFKEFYFSKGRYRAECKKCTVKHVVIAQRQRRKGIPSNSRSYMLEYYANNREKFAEYRRRFKERHPDYYRVYKQDLLNKPKKSSRDSSQNSNH